MNRQTDKPIYYNGSGAIKARPFKHYNEVVIAPKIKGNPENLPKFPYFPYVKQ